MSNIYEQYLQRRRLIPWRIRAWENVRMGWWTLVTVICCGGVALMLVGGIGDFLRSVCGCR